MEEVRTVSDCCNATIYKEQVWENGKAFTIDICEECDEITSMHEECVKCGNDGYTIDEYYGTAQICECATFVNPFDVNSLN